MNGRSVVLRPTRPWCLVSVGAHAAIGGTTVDEAQKLYGRAHIRRRTATTLAGNEFDDIVSGWLTG